MAKVDVNNSYTVTLRARWAGEPLGKETLVRGGARVDPAQFNAEDAVVVDVGAAGAAIGATSVPVNALSGPIPNGTVLDFGGTKFAVLTAAAAAGATTITVRALVTALVDADIATYTGIKKKLIVSGTVIGRTNAEAIAGTPFGPAANTDDQVYLLAFDIHDALRNPDADLYRYGRLVKMNFLPQYATMGATLLGKVRTNYEALERGVA